MKVTVQLASVPDRDDVVAEIWHGPQLIAEISRRSGGDLRIDLYAKPDATASNIQLREFEDALAIARQRLVPT